MAGKIVRTVLGDIAPEELGFTSLHDHTFLDMRQAGAFLEQMFPDVTQDQVAFVPENFTYLKTGTFLINHDLQIVDDIDELVSEYGHFRDLGGRSIFDAAPIGIRGNVRRIAELSRRSGLSYESTRRKITGQGPLTVEELVALSSAVECSAGEVLMQALTKGRVTAEVAA